MPQNQNTATPSRCVNSRLAINEDAWVWWNSNGRDDVSRVRDMSLGGLFLQTPAQRPVGAPTKLDFLVTEGQIRDAVIRHISGGGLGLKFIAVSDRPRHTFLRRLRF
jgi:hypothetical protein